MNISNYGGYFPYGNAYNQQMQPMNNQQATQDERIWVQNETSAEAYLVAPNSFVRLWDSQRPVFYEKRADASGRPFPMETFEYKRKQPQSTVVEESTTVLLEEQIEALTKRIEALECKKGVKANAKSNADDSRISEV